MHIPNTTFVISNEQNSCLKNNWSPSVNFAYMHTMWQRIYWEHLRYKLNLGIRVWPHTGCDGLQQLQCDMYVTRKTFSIKSKKCLLLDSSVLEKMLHTFHCDTCLTEDRCLLGPGILQRCKLAKLKVLQLLLLVGLRHIDTWGTWQKDTWTNTLYWDLHK